MIGYCIDNSTGTDLSSQVEFFLRVLSESNIDSLDHSVEASYPELGLEPEELSSRVAMHHNLLYIGLCVN